MPTLLHVGCGPKRKDRTTAGFNQPQWRELRLDIDVSVKPDVVGTMTDMRAVADASVVRGVVRGRVKLPSVCVRGFAVAVRLIYITLRCHSSSGQSSREQTHTG